MSTESKPSNLWLRRLSRFSLKSFFVLLTLLIIVFGTWLSRARRQQQSVNVLRDEYSAHVVYEYDSHEQSGGRPKLPIPEWLVRLVGVDAFNDVVLVSVRDVEFSDSDMVHLSRFEKLSCLRLAECKVSGEGFVAVKDLRHLKELYLIDVPIGDEAVEDLKTMSQLRWLNVKGTQITKSGVQTLKKHLPKCQIYSTFETP